MRALRCHLLTAPALILLASSCDNGTGPFKEDVAWASVSAGGSHTCALTVAGIAYCWGSNNYAQLGGGPAVRLANHFQPIPVTGGLTFAEVSAGALHTCALDAEGAAYCWGRNSYGQLGTGSADGPVNCGSSPCASMPEPVKGGLGFQTISAGRGYTCALSRAGEAYCWGANSAGQLGTSRGGAAASRSRQMPGLNEMESVGAEQAVSHACSLAEDGRSYCPVPLAVESDLRFVAVSAGYSHACAVAEGGSVYCWGRNRLGQVGPWTRDTCFVNDISFPCSSAPVSAGDDLEFQTIAAGREHTCGFATEGAIYCWGDNGQAQLGIEPDSVVSECTALFGHEPYACTPHPVRVSGGLVFVSLTAGGAHNCGLVDGGQAYCWGGHLLGQLGDCSLDRRSSLPSPVCGGHRFVRLSAGSSHSCAISLDRAAYCWGTNDSGELGGGIHTAFGPVRVEAPVGTSDG